MRNQSLFVKKMIALAMALMFLVASNVTRVEAAPVNNLTPEQIEAIATEYVQQIRCDGCSGDCRPFRP